ncbi:MAG TPA: hypothetical protein VF100_09690 [Thermoanaerobaculia bacterium]
MPTDRPRLPAAPLTSALLAAALVALPAAADDVHLVNGNVLEDVVAHFAGEQVVIQMAGGTLRLPASRVERIEVRESVRTEYFARRRGLAADTGASAADWLALARWARERGFESGFREAARKAATLDPDLAGLPPLMQALGFVRDEPGGPWVTPDERMARRGYVRHEGSWITAGERAELLRAEAERSALARQARRDASRDRALVELAAAARVQAEASRAREERELRESYAPVPFVYSVPAWFVPIPVPVPVPVPGQPPAADPPPRRGRGGSNRGVFDERRVPGSLGSAFIPGRLNPEAAPPPGRLDGD